MLPSPHRASASSSQATFAPSKQESSQQTNWLLPFIIVFAWLWRSVKWFWTTVILLLVANFFITLLTTGLNNGNDPRQWVVVLGAQEHLLTAGSILTLAALLAFAAYRADHSQQMAAERKKATWQYILKRVDHLHPQTDLAIEAYVKQVYLPRKADTEAGDGLHHAVQREDVSPLGICITGRPALGKTRLIWEAIRAELPSAMFVRWPHEQHYTLDYEALRGKTVVLWLDDLHKFANQKDSLTLADVRGYFERVNARLVIITTCREGKGWDEAGKHLGDVIALLEVVAPQDITPSEADHLTVLLKQANPHLRLYRDQFDGTPGSLLLGVRRMRTLVYPTLETGKKVLWALKLLRSANIYTYPVSRVRAAAVDVFGLDSNHWDSALREVEREGFVRREKRRGTTEMRIAPVADVYLDEAIPDYPLPGASLSDDWGKLEACLKRSQDASALTSLGGAFLGETSLDPLERNQHVEHCCLAAFEVLTREEAPANWAAAQNLLGLALLGQSEETSGETKAELEDQAIAAFNAALTVFTQEQAPAGWMQLQNHLTNALSVKVRLPTGTTGTLGDQPSVPRLIEGDKKALSAGAIINLNLLEQKIASYHAELKTYTQANEPFAWAVAQFNLAVLHWQQVVGFLQRGEQNSVCLPAKEAFQCIQHARSYFTPEGTPAYHAITTVLEEVIARIIDAFGCES